MCGPAPTRHRLRTFWAACADAHLPVHTHSGEAPRRVQRHLGIYLAEVVWWAAALVDLLFSGASSATRLMFVVTEAAATGSPLQVEVDQYMGGHTTKKMAALLEGKISKLPPILRHQPLRRRSTMSPERSAVVTSRSRRRHVGTDYPTPRAPGE